MNKLKGLFGLTAAIVFTISIVAFGNMNANLYLVGLRSHLVRINKWKSPIN